MNRSERWIGAAISSTDVSARACLSLMFATGCVILISAPVAAAQNPQLSWLRQFGGSGSDVSAGVSVDGSGNVYTVGGTSASLGGTNAGGQDVLISKYNSAGTVLWRRQFGSNSDDFGESISADHFGNAYVSGFTYGAIGGPSAGDINAFVTKYDAGGTLQWTKQLATAANDYSLGVSADGLGNLYVAGHTYGTLSGTNLGAHDAFLTKYDAAGALQWTRQFGTAADDIVNGVSADGLGNVYIAGTTRGPLGGTYAGDFDAFVTKYNADGTLQWHRQLGTVARDEGRSVSADALGNIYLTGYCEDSLLNPSVKSIGFAFVSKYDATGTLQWISQLDRAYSYGSAVDGSGDVFVSGFVSGSLDGPQKGDGDAFVARFSAAGSALWVKQLGTNKEDNGPGVAVDGSGNVYLAGYTSGALGVSLGGRDAFLARFSPLPEPDAAMLILLGASTLCIHRGCSRRDR